MSTTISTHAYVDDRSAVDWRGGGHCAQCGMPKANRAHKLPRVPDEVVQFEARKVGEAA